jgi:hypothetical protein
MDTTKEKAIKVAKGDYVGIGKCLSDGREVAQAYLTQCEEIDAYKTKNIINGELRIYYRNQAFEEAAELAEDYYEADNLIQLQVEIAKAIRARINHE